ncbi:MAG: manganese efflux pump [Clostridia bacterium]|nr:manganese efflux pump [Clostridia bacterium]
MTLLETLVLGVSLSADAFAVSVCKGLAMGRIKFPRALIVGAWFGVFQALMPTVGYFLGTTVGGIVGKWGFIPAFIILATIGGKMIFDALRGGEEKTDGGLKVKEMLLLSVATSIDALAAGVSMALVEVNIILSVTIIGLTTLTLSTAGVYVGGIFGGKCEKPARIAGGAALVALAVKILIEGILTLNS